MTQEEFNEYCKKHNVKVFGINYKKMTEKDMNAILKVIKDIESDKTTTQS